MKNLLSIAIAAIVLTACGGGGGNNDVSNPPPLQAPPTDNPTIAVGGQVSKGPLDTADLDFLPIDSTGLVAGSAVVTAITAADGSFTANIPVGSGALLVRSSGGTYVDEADREPDAALKRRITLSAGEGLEGLLPPGTTTTTISIATQALLDKTRRESVGDLFLQTFAANRALAEQAFGFDIVSTIPANPVTPDPNLSEAQRQYAMVLGGLANIVSRVSIDLGFAVPNIETILAVASDFSDGRIDGMVDGDPVMVGQVAINAYSLTDEITRFRNNNFDSYAGTQLVVVNETVLSQPGIPVNTIPVAGDDNFQLDAGTTLDVAAPGVLLNDTDADGDTLTAVLQSGPSNALVFNLEADGSFFYQHDGSSTAADSFSYLASDGVNDSNIATVTLNFNNTAPVANNDTGTVAENGLLTATTVLVNDVDANGNSLTARLITAPLRASTFDFAADGTYVYRHDGSETTSDVFTYVANDGFEDSAPAQVSITIIPVNDPPIAVADSLTVDQGESQSVLDSGLTTVLANDIDAENDILTATLVDPPQSGQLSLNSDGTFNYFHDGGPDAVDQFSYFASDGVDNSAATLVSITINPAGNRQPIADDDRIELIEGDTQTVLDSGNVSVLDNDFDDDGDPLEAILLDPPANGLLDLQPDGRFTYEHDGSHTSNDSFFYVASDGQDDSDPAEVLILIETVNDDPVGVADSLSVATDGSQTILDSGADSVLANDSDEEGSPLTAILDSGPQNGQLALAADGTFVYLHDGGATTTDTFFYIPSDGLGISTTVEVAAGNQAIEFPVGAPVNIIYELEPTIVDNNPNANGGVYSDATELLIFEFPTLGINIDFRRGTVQTFNDTSTPDDQIFIFGNINNNNATVGGLPVLSIDLTITGDTTMLADDSLPLVFPDAPQEVFALINTAAGQTFVTFSVPAILPLPGLPGNASPVQVDVAISPSGGNSAPTDIGLSNNSIDEGEPSGTPVGDLTTIDADAGDIHLYSLVAGAGDNNNFTFRIVGDQLQAATPLDSSQTPTLNVRIRTDDQNGGTFEEAFTIVVNPVGGGNNAPTAIDLDNDTIEEGLPSNTVIGAFTTTDPDIADDHTYALVAGAGDTDNNDFNIDNNELQTSIVFDVNDDESRSIRVQTDDGNGGTFEENFTIFVLSVPGDNALLAALDLTNVQLEPQFEPFEFFYTASVPFTVDSTQLTVFPDDDNVIEILLNGQQPLNPGIPSASIPLLEGINILDIEVLAEDGATTEFYTIEITRENAATFAQTAYIKASNPDVDDQFGRRIAVSNDGNTLAISALFEDSAAAGVNGDQIDNSARDSGAVYIFDRAPDGVWTQQAYLKASNNNTAATLDSALLFGYRMSMSADGNTLAVASRGEGSSAQGINGDQSNGDAPFSGAAYVFVRDGTDWNQQAYIKSSNSEEFDAFGRSIAVSGDGDTLAVGASSEGSAATGINGDQLDNSAPGSGAAYVFTRSGAVWTQQAYIKASNAESGDQLGYAISLSANGDTLAVTAGGEASAATGVNGDQLDNSAPGAGALYVFTRNVDTWSQQAYLKASNTDADDQLGSFAYMSISDDGDTLAVGAPDEDSAATGIDGDGSDNSADGSGAVYVYTRNAGVWSSPIYVKASNTDAGDSFGRRVSLSPDGSLMAIGAVGESSAAQTINGDQADNTAVFAGAVYLFARDGNSWSQQGYFKAPNAEEGDNFGWSLAVLNDAMFTGALGEDGSAPGINGDLSLNNGFETGAAYVFSLNPTPLIDNDPPTALMLSNQSVLQNQVSGTTVGTFSTVDADSTDGHDYSLVTGTGSTDNIFFQIADNELQTATTLDATQTPLLSVRVRSDDGNGGSIDKVFQIRVFAPNNAPTDIQLDVLTVAELDFSTQISNITVDDPDINDSHRITVVNGAGDENNDQFFVFQGASQLGISANQDALVTPTLNVRLRADDTFGGVFEKAFTFEVLSTRLIELLLSGVDLAPAFEPGVFDYTATVPFTTDSTTVAPTAISAGATIMVNGVNVDSGGVSAPISLAEGANTISITLGNENVAPNTYTITITRETAAAFAQQAYIKASNTDAADTFGNVVALSGDGNTMAVGSDSEGSAATGINGDQSDNTAVNAGAVYVFIRDGSGIWSQQAYVKASNTDTGDFFGATAVSLSADGNTLAVTATGEDSAATGINGDQNDNSVLGAGAAYVFTRDGGGIWSQQAYVKASNTGSDDFFGQAAALSDDGNTLAVGANGEDSAATGINGDQSDNSAIFSGAVYVYTRDGGGLWSQQAYVKASNTEQVDQFAVAVGLSSDGNTLAVGARSEDSAAAGINGDQNDNTASASGAAYVYTRDGGGIWSQQAYVKASNPDGSDIFGIALSLSDDGNTLAVGADSEASAATGIDGDQSDNSTSEAGAVYVYTRDGGGIWSQQAYVKASNTDDTDLFGTAVSLSGDGNTLAVGSSGERSAATGINGDQSNNNAFEAGAVYVYTRDGGGIWSQQAYTKASNTDTGDFFGHAAALSNDGNTLAVGALGEGSAATGIDGDQSDNSADFAGAVYVFDIPADPADADLNSISLSGVMLDQPFDMGVLNYTATVPSTTDSTEITPTAANGAATILVNGMAVASGQGITVALVEGDNIITITVTSEDGTVMQTYTIVITRPISILYDYIKASNTGANDLFGTAVAMSADGNTMVVGAQQEMSAATGVNGNEADDTANASGAAYVFTREAAAAAGNLLNNAGFDDPIEFDFIDFSNWQGFSGDGTPGVDTAIFNSTNNPRTGAQSLELGIFDFPNTFAGVLQDVTGLSAGQEVTFSGFAAGFLDTGGVEIHIEWRDSVTDTEISRTANLTPILSNTYEPFSLTDILPPGADTARVVFAIQSFSGALNQVVFLDDVSFAVTAWTQRAYLKASNTEAFDFFGENVAISADGNLAAVAAPAESSNATGVNGDQFNNNASGSGAVYLFGRDTQGNWSQLAYLKASDTEASANFGDSLSLAADGRTLAVGSPLESSLGDGVNPPQDPNVGGSVGAVYVFIVDGFGNWSQQAFIKATNSDANDFFGDSVALAADGNTLAVGATQEDSAAVGIDGDETDNTTSEAGAAYIYVRNPATSVWTPEAYIKASNTGAVDRFGDAVALSADGNRLAVAAENEDSAATGIDGDQLDNSALTSGAVYIFERNFGEWAQQAYVKASNTENADRFGRQLSFDAYGEGLIVTAAFEDSSAVGINGDESGNAAQTSGAAYLFDNISGQWVQELYIKASNTETSDFFGVSASFAGNGNSAALGATNEDSAAVGVNGDQADNSASNAGAIYVLTGIDEGSSIADLSNLLISGVTLDPQFNPGTLNYTASVPFTQASTSLTTFLADPGANVLVNGLPYFDAVAGPNIQLNVGENVLSVLVTAEDGSTQTYTVVITRQSAAAFAQAAYIKASNTDINDLFGRAVILSDDGSTMAVGVQNEDSAATGVNGNDADNSASNAGAVYVFIRDGGGAWSQQAYIKASNTEAGDFFGDRVSLSDDGNTLAVSATVEASSATGINGDQQDNSAVNAGAVYVFTRDGGGIWTQQAYIKASNTDANDRFGRAVTLSDDGTTLAVGTNQEASATTGINGDQQDNSAAGAGAVYVFIRDGGGNWSQQAYLKASNTEANDVFGHAVSISDDGNTLVAGAFREASAAVGIDGDQNDNNAIDAGAAYVYIRDGSGIWSQQAYIKASNTDSGDSFGLTVTLSGNGTTLAVGATSEGSVATGINGNQNDNSAADSGAAYVYTRDGNGAWSQQAYLKSSNTETSDFFGQGLSISGDGNKLVVGAGGEDSVASGVGGDQSDSSASNAGAVYAFSRDGGGIWSQQAYIKASNTDAGDNFGSSAGLSGDGNTLVIGATGESSAATGIDGDQSDNSASVSGAVYVFDLPADPTTANLNDVLLSGITLDQAFDAGLFNYTATVPFITDSAEITPTAANGAATITVNGTPVNSGQGITVVLIEGDNIITITVTSEDGTVMQTYTIVITRESAIQIVYDYIKASNTDAGDLFGIAHALSDDGNTLIVGADLEDSNATGINGDQVNNGAFNSGAAYVYTRDAQNVWSQQAYLKGSNTEAGDSFGFEVAISGDGNLAAVTAPFEGSNAAGIDGDQLNNLASSSGAAYLFARDNQGNWSQRNYFKASDTQAGAQFGSTIAMASDGRTLVVGSPGESSLGDGVDPPQDPNVGGSVGAAYVFTIDGFGNLSQQAFIKATNSDAGDFFADSVSLSADGNTLAVGATSEGSSATGVGGNEADNSSADSGAAYIYVRDPATAIWQAQAYIKATNTDSLDEFGGAVALSADGTRLAVSAEGEDSADTGIDGDQLDNTASSSGAVYIYDRDGQGNWLPQAYIKASNTDTADKFGSGLGFAANRRDIIVGAESEDSAAIGIDGDELDNSAQSSGAAYIFFEDAGQWIQELYIKASNTGGGDLFGEAVAFAGNARSAVIGAGEERSAATGINGDQADNSALEAGALYALRGDDSGSSNADLSNIVLDGITLSPQFDPAVSDYTATVPFTDASTTVTAFTVDPIADDILVNGLPLNHGETSPEILLDEGTTNISLIGTAEDGSTRTYTIVITRESAAAFAQSAYMKASNTDSGDNFGAAVSLSSDGNTMAVGAVFEAGNVIGINGDQSSNAALAAGAVFVFIRDGGGIWSQQAYVKASNTNSFDQFGESLSLSADGNTLAVGAPLEDSNAIGINGDQSNNIASNAGAVYVYTRDGGGIWSQQAYIKASNTATSDFFGNAVTLSDDGNTLAVGANSEDSAATGVNGDQSDNTASGAGAVYVYVRDGGGVWSQQAYIKASNTDGGDIFGAATSLSGDGNTLSVSALGEASAAIGINGDQSDNTAASAGAIYIYTRDGGGNWSQQAYVKASNTDSGDSFGISTAISTAGNTLAAGAIDEGSATTGINGDQSDNTALFSGAVYVYVRDGGGTWSQQAYIKASNTDSNDSFGEAVSLSGDGTILAVGADFEDGAATGIDGDQQSDIAPEAGAAYVFIRDGGGTWSQQAYVKASNTEDGDFFGLEVTLSTDGGTLAVAASLEDSAATGVNGDQNNNAAAGAGAVYVFEMPTDPADADLNNVLLSGITLDQSFDENLFNYTATVPFTTDSTEITPSAANGAATITVNGTPVISGQGITVALIEGDNTITITVTSEDGQVIQTYTIVIARQSGIQVVYDYIKASNSDAGDFFGIAQALSDDGNTMIIGADAEDSVASSINGNQADNSATNSGAAYVFTRDVQGAWSQQAYLKASNSGAGDFFGSEVVISGDGNLAAVAAPLEASNATGIDGDQLNNLATGSGAVYLFGRDNQGNWSQRNYLKASDTQAAAEFGSSIAISSDGRTLVVGSPGESSLGDGVNPPQEPNVGGRVGAAYVFTIDGFGNLSQQAFIKATNSDSDDDFANELALSADGNTLAVGAINEDSSVTGVGGNQSDNSSADSGAAYVYVRDPATAIWQPQAYIKATNTDSLDEFGEAVALSADGTRLAVSAQGEDSASTGIDGDQLDNSASSSGAVYIYDRDGQGNWSSQTYIKASNTEAFDFFGSGLDFAANRLDIIVGAQSEDSAAIGVNGDQLDNSAVSSGAAYTFYEDAGQWIQELYIKASNTDGGDLFGEAVTFSGNAYSAIIGAGEEDSDATGINGDQTDNLETEAGAVYALRGDDSGSSNADLSNIVLDGITLSPQFDPAVSDYTATVPFTDASTTVTAFTVDPIADDVLVNGLPLNHGETSPDIFLDEGTTKINLIGTAEDGSTRTYTVVITRILQGHAQTVIGEWKFDGNFQAEVVGTNDALANNTPDFTAGVSGQALSINQQHDYAYIDGALAPVGIGPFAISAWVRYDGDFFGHARHESPLTTYDGGPIYGVFIFSERPEISLDQTYWTGSGQQDFFDVRGPWIANQNAWQHIVIGRDASNQYLCLNGQLERTIPISAPFDHAQAAFNRFYVGYIPFQNGGRSFPGDIDELYIYDNWIGGDGCATLFANPGQSSLNRL